MRTHLELVSETTSHFISVQKVNILNIDLTWSFHPYQSRAEGFGH